MSATNSAPPPQPSGAAGRLVGATIVLFAITIALAALVYLGDAHAVRIDLTRLGEHTLAPRTTRLLDSVESPIEIILVEDPINPSAPNAETQTRLRQRVTDLLREFDRASAPVTFSQLSAVSRADRVGLESLTARLAALEGDRIAQRAAASERVIESAEELMNSLGSIAEALVRLAEVAESVDPRAAQLREFSAVLGAWPTEIETLRRKLPEDGLDDEAPVTVRLAAIDQVRERVTPRVRRAGEQLALLASSIDTLHLSGDTAQLARSTSQALAALATEAAQAADAIDRLPALDTIRILRALEAGPAVIVASRQGATAIEFVALFPEGLGLGDADEARFDGEELVAAAIRSLTSVRNPILVLVHPLLEDLLTETGAPATPDIRALLGDLLERLARRGVDVVEWAAALGQGQPSIAALDPSGERPVVWLTLGAAAHTAQAAERLSAMVNAVEALIASDANMLICVEPSPLPGVGEPDPMTAPLRDFGVIVDAGRPLLRQLSDPRGASLTPGVTITGEASDHVITHAINGLQLILGWATPITIEPREDVTTAPLVRLAGDANTWAESEWRSFRQVSPTQRPLLANPPTPDPQFDDLDGPWTLAVAAERRTSGGTQRLVVVGSNGWFFEEFTAQTQSVDGRRVPRYPGNAELFDASISWLAGQDEFIGASSRSRRTARIPPLAPGALAALRWAAILGPAGLVLATGLTLRGRRR